MAHEAVIKDLDGHELSTRTFHGSTYALRQELVRRGALDIPEGRINHNSLLKRMVEELVKQETKKTDERTEIAIDTAQKERDAAKALREKKKQEAIERSKARQAQKGYFDEKQEANENGQRKLKESNDASIVSEDTEADERCMEKPDDDPFRSYKRGRSKIHVS